MYEYRKKELDHKYTSIKDRIEELNEEDGEEASDGTLKI